MSKKRTLEKMREQKEHNEYLAGLDEIVQQKINGEGVKPQRKGLMDIVRKGKPRFGSYEELKSEKEAEAEVVSELEPESTIVTPKSEEAFLEKEPTKVIPTEEKPDPKTPPAWAAELVKSQKEFQKSVMDNFNTTTEALKKQNEVLGRQGKTLNGHKEQLKNLDGRLKELERWKIEEQTKAKTEVKAEAKELEIEAEEAKAETEVVAEVEPEKSEFEPESGKPESERPESESAEAESEETDLAPVRYWQAVNMNEKGEVSYSHPFRDIFVAEQFVGRWGEVQPFFGMIDAKGEIQRKMTLEELAKYGKDF